MNTPITFVGSSSNFPVTNISPGTLFYSTNSQNMYVMTHFGTWVVMTAAVIPSIQMALRVDGPTEITRSKLKYWPDNWVVRRKYISGESHPIFVINCRLLDTTVIVPWCMERNIDPFDLTDDDILAITLQFS